MNWQNEFPTTTKRKNSEFKHKHIDFFLVFFESSEEKSKKTITDKNFTS